MTEMYHFIFLLRVLFLAMVLSSLSAHAANLSVTEQRIISFVKAHSGTTLNLFERSVKMNSGTMNEVGVREVGELFRAEFDNLGFKTNWVEMPPAMQRAGHLIAEHAGTRGKRLLLIGHLDTVFEKDSSVPLWVRQGNKVAGQGVLDMKSGDAIIIGALRALREVGALEYMRIMVIFHGDEEHSGSPLEIARANLISAAKRSDVALAFENMVQNKDGKDTATIGRRAIGSFFLEVTGKPGHSAGIFGDDGYGAIYEMARILNDFRTSLKEPDLTFNVGIILGGTDASYKAQASAGTAFGKKNVIPQTALAEGDLRYLTHIQRDNAFVHMQEVVAKNLPGTSAKIHFKELYPPMAPTEGNKQLLDMYSQASQDANLGPIEALPPGLRGAGDVQFVAPFVDSLDGLGAVGAGAHSANEYVELGSIERATIRAALLIYRLAQFHSN